MTKKKFALLLHLEKKFDAGLTVEKKFAVTMTTKKICSHTQYRQAPARNQMGHPLPGNRSNQNGGLLNLVNAITSNRDGL